MKTIILASLLATSAAIGVAHADDDYCTNAPREKWVSVNLIRQKVKADGFEVRRVKIDGSCYEVKAVDPRGYKVEALFNPETGVLVRARSH